MIDTKTGFRVSMLRQAADGHYWCFLTDDIKEPMTLNRYVADLTAGTMEGPYESLLVAGKRFMQAVA